MQVDSQQLLDDGYIILPQVIPPDQLDELRHSFEILVERQKIIWAQQRNPDEPLGGAWETGAQPRVFFNEVVNRETANTIEFCLGENTLGVSRQLLGAPHAAVTIMALMCSPVKDSGPASWHRDFDPVSLAPLQGVQHAMLKNGPSYVQWNIPLYDDSVFWIVPGSHRRPNTPAEQQHLLDDPRAPIPGGIPVELKAGDGVVYNHLLLHWGSNYSAKLRRTVHLGYRSFGSAALPLVDHHYWNLDFTQNMPTETRQQFEHFSQLHIAQCDLIESTFRAVLASDSDAFLYGLETLYPAVEERMVYLIFLSRLVEKTQKLNQPEVLCLPFEEQVNATATHGLSFHLFEDFARRFSTDEANLLWQRFSLLFAKLQAETERAVPDLDSRVMRYQMIKIPANFTVEDFIASWDEQS